MKPIELGEQIPTFRAGDKPRYEVHDITVVTTDGRCASADVVYSVDGGDLMTVRVEYTDDRYAPKLCHTLPLDLPAGFISEIMGDCRDACRDLYKKLN